jgi:hypothetical protein
MRRNKAGAGDDGYEGKASVSSTKPKPVTTFQAEPTPPPSYTAPLMTTATTTATASSLYTAPTNYPTTTIAPPAPIPAEIPYNGNPGIGLDTSGAIPPGTTMIVVMPFVPTQDDELVLNRGDRVVVESVFEDGWGVGWVAKSIWTGSTM